MTDLGIVRRRIRGYWFVDGFQEIAGGVAFMSVGATLLAAELTNNEALVTAAVSALVTWAVIAAVAVRVAKRQITHVRTGWVRRSGAVGIAKVVGVVAWVAIAIPLMAAYESTGQVNVSALLAFAGVSIGAGAALRAWLTGLRRFYLEGALVTAAGLAAAIAGLGFRAGFAAIVLTCGVSLLAGGAWALNAYLHEDTTACDEAAS
jgi:hypothetical protein